MHKHKQLITILLISLLAGLYPVKADFDRDKARTNCLRYGKTSSIAKTLVCIENQQAAYNRLIGYYLLAQEAKDVDVSKIVKSCANEITYMMEANCYRIYLQKLLEGGEQ